MTLLQRALLSLVIVLQASAAATASDSLNELCLRLQHAHDAVDRLHAAEAVAEYGERAVPALCELLRDSDPRVREFTVLTLVRIGPAAAPAVPQLIALVQVPQDPARAGAVVALGRIGPAATPAVPALLSVAQGPDGRLRKDSLAALAAIRSPESVRALLALVHCDERERQVDALKAIQQCGPAAASALPDLLKFGVSTADPVLGDEAFLTAGRLGEEAVQELRALLNSDQAETRRRAALAFSRMGSAGEAAAPELQRALHDADPAVRFWAARALGGIGLPAPSLQAALVQALTDPDADVRWAAADALHRNGLIEVALELKFGAASLELLPPVQAEQRGEVPRAVQRTVRSVHTSAEVRELLQ